MEIYFVKIKKRSYLKKRMKTKVCVRGGGRLFLILKEVIFKAVCVLNMIKFIEALKDSKI